MPSKRIGVYSGTFNPVHVGHVAFALQALEVGELDEVYFLPERRPRGKEGVEHFAHRIAMLKQALKPHPKLHVLEFDDVSFSVQRTLPKLQKLWPEAQLTFLVGSDVVEQMAQWPHVTQLFQSSELIVGMRSRQTVADTKRMISTWSNAPLVTLINSHAPDVSSSKVREALQTRTSAKGMLKSVSRYSNHHWLYVSLA